MRALHMVTRAFLIIPGWIPYLGTGTSGVVVFIRLHFSVFASADRRSVWFQVAVDVAAGQVQQRAAQVCADGAEGGHPAAGRGTEKAQLSRRR